MKYRSSERPPHIEITAERRGAEWMFTIADNGIGIDPQYSDRIFTIFQRLHLRDEYGGTGIGLALCRKIVEFHRGQIRSGWARTMVPPVLLFTSRFRSTGPSATRQRPMSTESTSPPARTLRVLLVEDDAGDVLIAREALSAGKLSTVLEVVTDGVDAMAFLRRENGYASAVRPDLILLDLNLPRMSGHEVLASIKNDPRLRRIPVVVLTTSLAHEDIAKSYDLHAAVHVSKPVDFDDFAAVVNQIEEFFGTVAQLAAE